MHRLLAELFPYLVALYVVDGLVWVRTDQWLLVSWSGRRFRRRTAGIHLTGVVPTAEAVLTRRLPACLTSHGVYWLRDAARLGADDLDFTPYEALGRLEVEHASIRCEGRRLATAASPAAARSAVRRIDELRPLGPSARAGRIAAGATDAVNVAALRALRARHLGLAPSLRTLACALFALTFGALPVTLFGPPAWRGGLGAVLAAIGLAYGGLVVLSGLTLRRCGQDFLAAAAALLPLLMFPPAAVHALTLLGRDLYAGFDPLALAGVLLDRATFASLARREYHGIAAGRASSAGTPLAEWWAVREAAWHALLEGLAVSRDEVLAAPPRTDAAAAAYCPACWTAYRIGFAACGDCGFPLRAFERA